MVCNCFECNKDFSGYFSIKCYFARHHDDKIGVCKCEDDLFSGVCIKNVCSKSVSEDENVEEKNDLVKNIVKDKSRMLDKIFYKTLDKDQDRNEDDFGVYIYARSDFTVNNAKDVRHKPRRACKKCKS